MLFNRVLSQSKKAGEYALTLAKWIVFSIIIGSIGALAGVLFHFSVDTATHFRTNHPDVIFLLPIAGIIIVFLYHTCNMDNDKGTNQVLDSVRTGGKVSFLVAPLIIISTTLTHLCGGSSGREGAALQIGGSIGSKFACILKLKDFNTSVCIMCGMSALFSAVFGTPLTAAIFALEVVNVGVIHYSALLPVVFSSLVSFSIAGFFHVEKTEFLISAAPEINFVSVTGVLVLSVLVAIISILFVLSMHNTNKFLKTKIPNKYIRVITGAAIVIVLTLLLGTFDYNGAGMDIIAKAVENGTARPEAFILKLVFTVITLSSGFKGGEIVPTFFIGSTFGVLVAPLVGLNPSFAAAIGLVALFCGVVNCPIASIILSIELFGTGGVLYFAMAVAVSYVISGYYSLYSGQKIVYSKLKSDLIDIDAK